MNVGIVPAKLESRRLERKNIRSLGDRPLVAYTLQAALRSRSLSRIVLSTDSATVEQVAEEYSERRVDVVRRSGALAHWTTTAEEVLLDIADRCDLKDDDAIVTLLPTSPFRSRDLIDRCVRLFKDTRSDSVLTVRRDRLKLGVLESNRAFSLSRRYPAEMHRVEPIWIDNPAVYVTRLSALRTNRFVLGERCYGVEVDRIEGHDINEPLDWIIAEAILANGLFTPEDMSP